MRFGGGNILPVFFQPRSIMKIIIINTILILHFWRYFILLGRYIMMIVCIYIYIIFNIIVYFPAALYGPLKTTGDFFFYTFNKYAYQGEAFHSLEKSSITINFNILLL